MVNGPLSTHDDEHPDRRRRGGAVRLESDSGMTSPRLALALRNLAALALAAPVACVIDNPGFMIDSGSMRTGTDTASSTGSTGTGVVDDVTTADVTTDARPTSTTVSTLPSDTTGGPSTSDGSTTAVPDIDGCIETSVKFRAEADGFYIAGGTEGGTTCMYAEAIAGQSSPCKFLNFGVTHGMRVSPRTPRRRTRLARRAWPRTCTRRGP